MKTIKGIELLPGEEVVIAEPIHWKNYIIPATSLFSLFAILAVRLALPEVSFTDSAAGAPLMPEPLKGPVFRLEVAVLVVLIAASARRMLQVAYTQYAVTTRRIICRSGLVAVRMEEMLIDRCETVTLKQSPYERLFGAGDITCMSAGASIWLDDVRNARAFRSTLLRLTRKGTEGRKDD